jgi:hypothetical protein
MSYLKDLGILTYHLNSHHHPHTGVKSLSFDEYTIEWIYSAIGDLDYWWLLR